MEVVLCEEAYWDHPSFFGVLESSLLVRYPGSLSTESRNRLSAVTGELNVSCNEAFRKDPCGRSRFALPILPHSVTILLKTAAFRSLIRKTSGKEKSKEVVIA